jgi:hypothetical protein
MDWECPKTKDGKKCKTCLKKGTECHRHQGKNKQNSNNQHRKETLPLFEISLEHHSVPELRDFFAGKKLLHVGGCFCPPHIGHYNMVEEYIKKVKPDVFLIYSTNRESDPRHGTPLEHTKETWDIWGNILARKYNITYGFDKSYDMVFNGSMENIKEYVASNVWENEMPDKFKKNPLEHLTLEGMSMGFLNKVPRDFDGYYKYHIQRKPSGFSATKFTKCLKDFSQDCIEYVPNDVKGKKEYIDNIRRRYKEALK